MFFHAPNNIYGPELLRMFIDELGGIKRVHKYLGVSERTVWNWISSGRAPVPPSWPCTGNPSGAALRYSPTK